MTKYSVSYSAVEQSVTIIFYNEKNRVTATPTMSVRTAMLLGKELTELMNPTNESNKNSRTRAADSPNE